MAEARAKRALSLHAVERRDTKVFSVMPLQDWISLPSAEDSTPTSVSKQMMLKEIAASSRIQVLARLAPSRPSQFQESFHFDMMKASETDPETQREATEAAAGR